MIRYGTEAEIIAEFLGFYQLVGYITGLSNGIEAIINSGIYDILFFLISPCISAII